MCENYHYLVVVSMCKPWIGGADDRLPFKTPGKPPTLPDSGASWYKNCVKMCNLKMEGLNDGDVHGKAFLGSDIIFNFIFNITPLGTINIFF